jgi:PTS system fructose-specific IIC component
MKFVAVTSCPTGIAHTYMAAESLEHAAAAAGHEIVVETQGAGGSDKLDPAVIAGADAVIFAADVEVQGKERFAGKPTVATGVKGAINDGPGLISQAEQAAAAAPAPAAGAVTAGAGAGAGASTQADVVGGGGGPALASKVDSGAGFGTRLRQWLMTGVSYLIPFVAAGGLLLALGFALNTIAVGDQGYLVTEAPPVTEEFDPTQLTSWAALCFQIGQLAFAFLVPVLAGFIAFAMGDRPGIAPGFTAGAVAVAVGGGFLGGLVGGLLAGAIVMWLKKVKLPFAFAGVWTVVVIPLVGSLLAGGLMFLVLGPPIAAATESLTSWLDGFSTEYLVILGVILGLMMAFDMGGPVNKVAYTFGVASLTSSFDSGTDTGFQIMAAVMAAGMVPPLALALAATLRPQLFTPAEQQNAKPAWLLGASFITEGAIPFAAADPLRVIPSIMAGSAVAGGLVMAFGSTLQAPHGGIFVVPFIGNPWLFLAALLAGTVVAAFAVIAAKSTRRAEKQLHDAEVGAGLVPAV